MKTFLILLALPGVALASENQGLPPEVAAYIVDRELCDHFRQEPADGGTPEQDERRQFVRESIEIYCAGTDRRLEALKRRYAGDTGIQSRLEKYEMIIEAPCR